MDAITIAAIQAREVLDSRGNPTVAAEVRLSNGVTAQAMVPSGASTGRHEAVELRDHDPARYGGRGVLKAVANVNNIIAPNLTGRPPDDQAAIDASMLALDPTPNKSELGANAILSVSLAIARAAATARQLPLWQRLAEQDGETPTLPVPMFNILNGGRHASNSADIQEFMVLPTGAKTFAQALQTGAEIYHALRQLLHHNSHNLNVGDEGGFAPALPSNRDALELVLQAVETAGYRPGHDVHLALDVAATELYNPNTGQYVLEREGVSLTAAQLIDLYAQWTQEYPIISIEDGLSEDDWQGWQAMRQRLGNHTQLVGDDLLVTNPTRIRRSITEQASNAILLKPNQIGTLTETRQALTAARNANWGAIISHRSGETEDTTIADLAVGWNIQQIKTGAPARAERTAKYNRLLQIESELGDAAKYAGPAAFDYLERTL